MIELKRMCTEVRPPSPQAVEEGRRRLLAAARDTEGVSARRSFRRPRTNVRLAALGALTVAMIVGTTVAQDGGGTDEKGNPKPVIPGIPSGPVANAADVLNRAAIAAEGDPSTPRPDQWAFTEDKQQFPAIGTRVVTPRTALVDFVSLNWYRIDGKQAAALQKKPIGDGKLRITDSGNSGSTGWTHDHPTLATMPTDPNRVAGWVKARGVVPAGPPGGWQATVFLARKYTEILREGVAPPKAEAAVFRAITLLPGVALKEDAVDLAGRKAVAVGLTEEGYVQTEILLDQATYRFLGERVIAIKDHTGKGDDGTWIVKKGSVINLQVRTASGIVDKPGQIS